MKRYLIWNQHGFTEAGVDVSLQAMLLFSYLETLFGCPNMDVISVDGRQAVWVSHGMVRNDLPLLLPHDLPEKSSQQKLSRLLKELENAGVIFRKRSGPGARPFVGMTERAMAISNTSRLAENRKSELRKSASPHSINSYLKNNPPISPPEGDNILKRVMAFFPERTSTGLTKREKRLWQESLPVVMATHEDDWRTLEWRYSLDPAAAASRYRRRSLSRLLSHWNGEISRAQIEADKSGVRFTPQKQPPPNGWRDFLVERYDGDPERISHDWDEIPDDIQREVRKDFKPSELLGGETM
jgi:hypothetical protein